METKQMTKEEIFKYLKDTKVFCTCTEETQKVQKKLFELKYKYVSGSQAVKEDIYLLYIYNGGVFKCGTDLGTWISDTARRIEPNEILSLELKEEEKPKFDPKTLRPFEKVLVRDKEGDRWRCNLFCHINEELMRKYFCVFDNWIYCIPYNEETKHLHDTNNEAPEFYRM